MGRNTTWIDAPPEQVFDVLADPYTYDDWVVGTTRIRDADESWPKVGSKLYHTVGFPPVGTRDNTQVLAVERPSRLELEARGRPFGKAKVELRLEPSGDGTRVTIVEDPAGFTAPLKLNPAVHLLIRVRNLETLRRLKAIAERRR